METDHRPLEPVKSDWNLFGCAQIDTAIDPQLQRKQYLFLKLPWLQPEKQYVNFNSPRVPEQGLISIPMQNVKESIHLQILQKSKYGGSKLLGTLEINIGADAPRGWISRPLNECSTPRRSADDKLCSLAYSVFYQETDGLTTPEKPASSEDPPTTASNYMAYLQLFSLQDISKQSQLFFSGKEPKIQLQIYHSENIKSKRYYGSPLSTPTSASPGKSSDANAILKVASLSIPTSSTQEDETFDRAIELDKLEDTTATTPFAHNSLFGTSFMDPVSLEAVTMNLNVHTGFGEEKCNEEVDNDVIEENNVEKNKTNKKKKTGKQKKNKKTAVPFELNRTTIPGGDFIMGETEALIPYTSTFNGVTGEVPENLLKGFKTANRDVFEIGDEEDEERNAFLYRTLTMQNVIEPKKVVIEAPKTLMDKTKACDEKKDEGKQGDNEEDEEEEEEDDDDDDDDDEEDDDEEDEIEVEVEYTRDGRPMLRSKSNMTNATFLPSSSKFLSSRSDSCSGKLVPLPSVLTYSVRSYVPFQNQTPVSPTNNNTNTKTSSAQASSFPTAKTTPSNTTTTTTTTNTTAEEIRKKKEDKLAATLRALSGLKTHDVTTVDEEPIIEHHTVSQEEDVHPFLRQRTKSRQIEVKGDPQQSQSSKQQESSPPSTSRSGLSSLTSQSCTNSSNMHLPSLPTQPVVEPIIPPRVAKGIAIAAQQKREKKKAKEVAAAAEEEAEAMKEKRKTMELRDLYISRRFNSADPNSPFFTYAAAVAAATTGSTAAKPPSSSSPLKHHSRGSSVASKRSINSGRSISSFASSVASSIHEHPYYEPPDEENNYDDAFESY